MKNQKTYEIYPVLLIYVLFFMWGFIWNLFNILATFFQGSFQLSIMQIALGTSLSFLTFFLMLYSSKQIITRFGTKNTISIGAIITAIGLVVFFPAAVVKSYNLFLSGLFVLFADVAILQTVCKPYIGVLGDIKNRAARINFAQGIGAVGAALTAPISCWVMLQVFEKDLFEE